MLSRETSLPELLDPTGDLVNTGAHLAPRPADLNGKVIGFLDNGYSNVDVLLAKLEALLSSRYAFAGIVRRCIASPQGTATKEMLDQIAQECDIAVTGVGH